MIAKRSKTSGVKAKNDKKSLIIFWITIPTSITLAFFNAKYANWDTINYYLMLSGLAIFGLGVLIRWISILQLKKDFTVDVAINKTHKLKETGMYKFIRHPSYLGLFLIVLGLSIAMNTLISLFVLSIPVFLAIVYRIKIEEQILISEFGNNYKEYMKRTKKIIPFIF